MERQKERQNLRFLNLDIFTSFIKRNHKITKRGRFLLCKIMQKARNSESTTITLDCSELNISRADVHNSLQKLASVFYHDHKTSNSYGLVKNIFLLEGSNKIVLMIHKEIYELANLGEFHTLCAIDNRYAFKIYKYLQNKKKEGLNEIVLSIDGLKRIVGLKTEDYSTYSNFKNKLLLPVIKRINSASDMKIVFYELKKKELSKKNSTKELKGNKILFTMRKLSDKKLYPVLGDCSDFPYTEGEMLVPAGPKTKIDCLFFRVQ